MKHDKVPLNVLAQYQAIRLERGWIDVVGVIAWAEEVIMSWDEPDGYIVDVALSGSRGINGVLEALRAASRGSGLEEAGVVLLRDLLEELHSGAPIQSVAGRAYEVARLAHQPDDVVDKLDFIHADSRYLEDVMPEYRIERSEALRVELARLLQAIIGS